MKIYRHPIMIFIVFLLMIPSPNSVLSLTMKTEEPLTGIDISWHSGDIQWDKVLAQNFGFIIVKATEGEDLKDKKFDLYWHVLKDMKVIRGAYHFYVTEDDPGRQAKFFIENVKLGPGDLRPIVDIELVGHGTEGKLYPKLKEFLDLLEAHYRVKPIIYTAPRFWDKHFRRHLSGYPLWVAEYGVDDPSIPEGWKIWHLWQYTENATISGIEKETDLSRMNKNIRDEDMLLINDPEKTSY